MSYQLNILCETKELEDYYGGFTQHHEGDSGVDLISEEISSVNPFDSYMINFHIKCQMIDLETNENVSYFLVPRSSITKTPFIMKNCVGIIDAGYRGNLCASVINMGKNQMMLKKCSIFQILSPDLKKIKVKIVKELSKTSRGDGGFGSTNITNNTDDTNDRNDRNDTNDANNIDNTDLKITIEKLEEKDNSNSNKDDNKNDENDEKDKNDKDDEKDENDEFNIELKRIKSFF